MTATRYNTVVAGRRTASKGTSKSRASPAPAGRSAPRPGALSQDDATELARLFKALGSPMRLRLLSTLRAGPRCVHELVGELHLEQSAVSHQLRQLRDLNVVAARPEGRHVYYSLRDRHVRNLFDYAVKHLACATEAAPEK